MQIRSTDLQCNRSPYILAITTLFAVTSLFQLNSILRTSSDHHVKTPEHPNAPLFYVQPVDESATTQRNKISPPQSTPHPLQPVSSGITTIHTIDLNDTKKKQIDRFLRRNQDSYGNKADTNGGLGILIHPEDYAPVVVDKGFAMNHLNASENISTTVPTNVATKTKFLTRATATGASSNHFNTLIAFLQNYKAHSKNIPLFTYDLGLSTTQLAFLRVKYPWTTIRSFNFSQYPPFFKIENTAGGYAWKPMIIKEMLDTTTSVVMWLDSGNRLTKANTLENIFSQISRDGHVTAVSVGTTQDWVHPATLAFLHAPTLKILMCTGGIVGFDMRAYEKVVRPWANCALERLCIAPPGASLANHRYDQAVLTVLLYQAERRFLETRESLGILTHQDPWAPHVTT
jgi:hypothetical protein